MDFHSLTRRELQTLCKKNKIPANLTNVAMADALKALEMVEGIEEIMQQSQSETAQSSIESLEVTSPYVPPTGGRSTRRRNVAKQEELESANPISRVPRTARTKTLQVKEDTSNATETPAVVARKNGSQMVSACRKMDSQLKECAGEEEEEEEEEEGQKKDVLMTPATSRRRRVVESKVKKVYSTRRSVRLAEKNVEEIMLNEDDNQLSGITTTGVDAITTMEETSENKDKYEIGEEIKLGSTAEEEKCVLPMNLTGEVQQSDVKNTQELNTEKYAESQFQAVDFAENVILETEDNSAVDKIKCSSDTDFLDVVEKEVYPDDDIGSEDDPDFDMTLAKFTELRLQKDTKEVPPGKMLGDDAAEIDSDFIDHLAIPHVQLNKDEIEVVDQLEKREKAAAAEVSHPPGFVGLDFTPSKHSITMRRVAGFSDNKENIASGRVKVAAAKNIDGNVDNLSVLSVRKLTKMLKEKLEITKKLSKNEQGKEALSRPALQALPENHQLVDGTRK